MGRYRIRVATGAWLFSGTHNRVQLWLVGERGEAELQLQLRPARGQVRRGSGTPIPARAVLTAGGWPGRGRRGTSDSATARVGTYGVRTPGEERLKASTQEGLKPVGPLLTNQLHAFPSGPQASVTWDQCSRGKVLGERAVTVHLVAGVGDDAQSSLQHIEGHVPPPRPPCTRRHLRLTAQGGEEGTGWGGVGVGVMLSLKTLSPAFIKVPQTPQYSRLC